MAAHSSTKVVLAAFFANLGIAIIKGFAAVVTRSGAMLAESIHSVADAGNQALLLLGEHRAKRAPDERHPFGYGSERYFWAFIVALVLFALGALFSLYEGVHKLLHPTPIRSPGWAYGVLITAILIETVSFVVAHRAVGERKGGKPFFRFFLETKDPAVPLVYLEDIGALVGLFFALVGVGAAHLLGWAAADALATLAIGLLLAAIAVILLFRCHRLLIGEGASKADAKRILTAARGVEGVHDVVDLKTLHLGPTHLIVGLEVRMDGGAETARQLEAAVQEAVPAAKYVAVEPV